MSQRIRRPSVCEMWIFGLLVSSCILNVCVRACVHNLAQWRHGNALSRGCSFTLIHLHTHMSRPRNPAETVITGREWILVWGVIVFPITQSSTYILPVCYRHSLWQRKLYVGEKKCTLAALLLILCPQS